MAEAEAENEEWWKERNLDSWFIWAWGDDGFSQSFCWDDDTETSEGETTVVFQSGFHRGLELPAPVLEWATAGVATDPNVRADAENWGLVESLLQNPRSFPLWKSPRVEIGMLIDHPFFRCYSGPLPTSSELTLIDLILVTGPLWLRPLETWKAPKASLGEALVSLVNHLLVAYRLPDWLHPDRVASFTDLFGGPYLRPDTRSEVWLPFLAAARGWRLGMALQFSASKYGFRLPAAAGRFAWQVPPEFTTKQAWSWVAISARGGSPELANALQDLWILDHEKLVSSLIGFFRRHPHLVDQAVPISEWAIHQFTESLRKKPATQKRPRFTLNGRSGTRVIEAVEQYFQQLAERAQAGRESTWPARHWDAELEVGGVRWTIRELCSGRALAEESAAMRHCVATYWPACEQGKCAIFSFRTEDQRTLTVEIDPATCVLRQARGFANRPARPAELAAVEAWQLRVHSLAAQCFQ